mgnify:CR=1 FL=1
MDQTAKTNQDLLLVIDMQNVYTKGQEWACEEVEKASDSILRLLNSRALSQVIFTQYLAAKHPEGVWKEYNKVNAAVNARASTPPSPSHKCVNSQNTLPAS